MKRSITCILIFIASVFAFDAVTQDFDKRFNFARSYVGFDGIFVPAYGNSYFINADGALEKFQRSAYLSPAINFGGTHFWGHADFYISIPIRNIKLEDDAVENALYQRVLTGFRIYPFKIAPGKLRPFFGYKFCAHEYDQSTINGLQSQFTKVKSILDIGLGYQTNKLYIYAGYNQLLNPGFDFYVSRTRAVSTKFPEYYFNVGVNWQLEITRTKQTEQWKETVEYLGGTNRHGLFVAAGPSSAFPTSQSQRIHDLLPFLDQQAMPDIFPDLSVGYHFSKWNAFTNVAFRPINQTRQAFAFEQTVKRRSLIAEVLKELGDYHGFVPFAGAGVSYENIRLQEYDLDVKVTDNRYEKFTPHLCFGWDIRPNRDADWIVIRTNLRYAPWLAIESGARELRLDYIEFNFIQIALFPGRKGQYGS